MTPAARLSAAIEVLDLYMSGIPVEKALTNWARRSRFAGSKDRAALRDIVFGCLRQRASLFHLAGQRSGRGLVLGYTALEVTQDEVMQLFSGEGHAPQPLTAPEKVALFGMPREGGAEADYDLQGWMIPLFEASLGTDAVTAAHALRMRAPMFLRVNLSRISRDQAVELLAEDGIVALPHESVISALRVTENPRRVAQSKVYLDGLVELQDASSQAICAGLPETARMLDYCAGGGGKVLAYGDRCTATLFAHDANEARLTDLTTRAQRAGISVTTLSTSACQSAGPFELVLVDAPCSGSGTWRRSPEAKWALTQGGLDDLCTLQTEILDQAASLVAPGGCLAYATCSVLDAENIQQVQSFIARNSSFELSHQERFLPTENGDGFFVAHLTRRDVAA